MTHINTYEKLKHEAIKAGVMIKDICNYVNYTQAGLKRAFDNNRASLTLKNDISRYIQSQSDTSIIKDTIENTIIGKISTKTARHSFAVYFLNRGGNLFALKTLLGHKKIESTLVYSRLVDLTLKDQISLID